MLIEKSFLTNRISQITAENQMSDHTYYDAERNDLPLSQDEA